MTAASMVVQMVAWKVVWMAALTVDPMVVWLAVLRAALWEYP